MGGAIEASRDTAAGAIEPRKVEVATREALLRAAIVDTPWSAAFISYLMKTAGFSRAEFEFSDTHADYVRAALDTSAAETEGRESPHAFRACDIVTTRPRAGDLVCATRDSTVGVAKFDALAAAVAVRATGEDFPMHCDLVVRSDEGGDAKLDAIGGNVVQSVTLTRMTLNANKVLSAFHVTGAAPRRLVLRERSHAPGTWAAARGWCCCNSGTDRVLYASSLFASIGSNPYISANSAIGLPLASSAFCRASRRARFAPR